MSLRSRFPQFGNKYPSRTPRVAALCDPTCASFLHRVRAPGCRAYLSLSSAPLCRRLTAQARFPIHYSTVRVGIRRPFALGHLFRRSGWRWTFGSRGLPKPFLAFVSSRFTHIRSQRFPPAFRSSFLPLLAWHSLGLKPCARRLAPLCFAQLQRALRVSAPPPTFPICRKIGSRKSCRSPRKSTPPGLGAAASRFSGAEAKRVEKE